MDQPRAILLLADGTFYEGKAAGKTGTATGEICFNTGMTGYQEVFTDPSYFGQLLVTTNAHIGNYGTMKADTESDSVKIAGLICKNFTVPFSRHIGEASIQDYLEGEELVGISDVDTRQIVRHIRTQGAMNGIISSEIFDLDELKKLLAKAPNMDGLELASKVTTDKAYTLGEENAKYRVAVLDLGTKKNILRNFVKRDCFVKVFPAKTSMDDIRAFNPDGLFLSNGPGDPGAMDYAVDTAKAMLEEEKPLFGICLGHQILARAVGIPTYKMHHGHRGINHPVKNLVTGKSEITSQNHGFGVSPEAIEKNLDVVEVTHRNLNDDTIEGIRIVGKPAFSVQYHPEASPGPHDAAYLFDQFVDLIAEKKG
ncbi:glutamine-hydrolyzing carbamoyl-phosphate synthase small subunit [Neolewinella persica]|uniref:glutamine-hydrolyzing carbamoyl-phosphate synthase small subunit n=1 Tax=Neolewinella persica TaxID=70998 RepID=UPI0005C49688|nr:glutamine-hydrolyzing carbamoyl-phosphate synthase small subunit [Neolewinella persica]